jgi:hypothetical protein
MNALRKSLCLLMALIVVAFSASATAAPTKKWSIAVGPSQVSFGSVQITLRIKNETPNGNSNINSLTVNLPAGYTIDTTKASPVETSYSGQTSYVAGAGGSVSISNMSPLKPQSFFTMTVWMNVGSSVSCGQGTVWNNGAAWTGSSFSGDTFQLVLSTLPGASNTTTVPASQTLAFSTPPSNVSLGAPVTFDVQASSCVTGASGVPINVTVKNSADTTVAGATGTTGSGGNASFSIPISTVGTYTITANSSGYPSVTATFSVFGGLLNCEPKPPFTFDSGNGITDPTQEGYAAGSRGFWNKDGMSCVPLLYTFTNTILTNNTVHLAWDTSAGQFPAFTYSMTWKTEDVDNPNNPDTLGLATNYGWPVPRRVSVAWLVDSNGPVFVPALACAESRLPAPYAMLHSSIADLQVTTLVVDVPPTVPTYVDPSDNTTKNYPTASIPGTVPFSIVIGTERMLVTAIVGNTWTVTRGYGGTTKAVHDASAYVMSTPLPIDFNAVPPAQVPMCVINHGWLTAGFNPSTGIPRIRYFSTVFDIGDGWVRIGNF